MSKRSRPFIETFGETRIMRLLTGQTIIDFLNEINKLSSDAESVRERGWRRQALTALSAEFSPGVKCYNAVGNNYVFAFASSVGSGYDWSETSSVHSLFPKGWFNNPNWSHPALANDNAESLTGAAASTMILSELVWSDVGTVIEEIKHRAEKVPIHESEVCGDVKLPRIRVLIEPYEAIVHEEGGGSFTTHLPVAYVLVNKNFLVTHSEASNRQLRRFMLCLSVIGDAFMSSHSCGIDMKLPKSRELSNAYAEDALEELTNLFNMPAKKDQSYRTWYVVEHGLSKKSKWE